MALQIKYCNVWGLKFSILFSISVFASEIKDSNTLKSKYIQDGVEHRISFYSKESVSSDKKIKRNGILIKRPGAKATVLICHGFMCDKYDVNFLHLLFKDYNTMTFDFRAHGEDKEDQYCTFGRNEAYDVLGAIKFLKTDPDIKKYPIIIYGFSMGAVSTVIAGEIDNRLCDAMILDCPFDSSDKLLDRGLKKIKMNFFGYEMGVPGGNALKNYAYSPYIQTLLKTILKTFAHLDATQVNTLICPVYAEDAIKYITLPVFIIACPNDDKAPEEAVRSVYEGATGFKRLWICGGRRHYDPIFYRMHEYIYRVNKFIKQIIDRSWKNKKQEKIINSTDK